MPIRITDSLPATSVLEGENIFVMTEYRALHQDIRPLNMLILNLRPTKIVTETQILRKLSNTPLQINVDLMYTSSYQSRNTDTEYLSSFYRTFDQVRENRYDGMIITGAPVENLDFQDVDYWDELCRIMEWSKSHVFSTLHICWGAQAAVYYHYGIRKRPLPRKLSGIFAHTMVDSTCHLFHGFDDVFYAPHSRYTEVDAEDLRAHDELQLLAVSKEAGAFAAQSLDARQVFVFGHPEYDAMTLAMEYRRDLAKGLHPAVPQHYFPGDDPTQPPVVNWRSAGQLLYTNWLNYYVYQSTPYDLREIDG